MTNELKNEIKEFLAEWRNQSDNKDIDLWWFYWESLELLEKIVNLENK